MTHHQRQEDVSCPQVILFGHARVEVWRDPPHVRTTFSDGRQVHASPHDTPQYAAQARELGYASAADMNAWHDVLHEWVAELLGGQSPTLRAIATLTLNALPWWVTAGEERMVLDLAAYLNGQPPQPSLAPLVMAGYSLDDLAERWRALAKKET